MTLLLERGTNPNGLEVCTEWAGTAIKVGDYTLSLYDFLAAVEYVLTNTNLDTADPRMAFLDRVRRAEVETGFSGKGIRLVLPDTINPLAG